MHLVASRMTWHEIVTLVALGSCALLCGKWYLSLIVIVNVYPKCCINLSNVFMYSSACVNALRCQSMFVR